MLQGGFEPAVPSSERPQTADTRPTPRGHWKLQPAVNSSLNCIESAKMLYMLENCYIGVYCRPACGGLWRGTLSPVFSSIRKGEKGEYLVRHVLPSVRPSAWKKSAPSSVSLYLKAFTADLCVQQLCRYSSVCYRGVCESPCDTHYRTAYRGYINYTKQYTQFFVLFCVV